MLQEVETGRKGWISDLSSDCLEEGRMRKQEPGMPRVLLFLSEALLVSYLSWEDLSDLSQTLLYSSGPSCLCSLHLAFVCS